MAWGSKPTVQELHGERLHLSHGPIDLVLKAFGSRDAVKGAYLAAIGRFDSILEECVSDLPELRRSLAQGPHPVTSVGQRMLDACQPFDSDFITPMAAVAGAVADEIMNAMTTAAPLTRAYVNNGGDIAVHVRTGATMRIGMAGSASAGGFLARLDDITISGDSGIGGVATSGAQGRSFSLGIADSVTVLARSAALADAAATMVANAVNIESSAVQRQPARDLDPDSDLRDILVTTKVGDLTATEIETALLSGAAVANRLHASGVISGACLKLRGMRRIVGTRRQEIIKAPQENVA